MNDNTPIHPACDSSLGYVSVPATCGEWMQGWSGRHGRVHISAPINWRTRAKITTQLGAIEAMVDTTLASEGVTEELPITRLANGNLLVGNVRPRTKELLTAMSDGVPPHTITVVMDTNVPVGKGMASSSADLGAAALAYEQARLGACEPLHVVPRRYVNDILEMITTIEPTDAVLYEGINYAGLDTGKIISCFQLPHQLSVVVCVPEESRNTMDVRANQLGLSAATHKVDDAAFAKFKTACDTKNLALLGELATYSAEANQEILPTPQFDIVTSIAKEHNALGVLVGHSGTVCGIIVPPPASQPREHSQSLHQFGDQYGASKRANSPVEQPSDPLNTNDQKPMRLAEVPHAETAHKIMTDLAAHYTGRIKLVRIDERGPITMNR